MAKDATMVPSFNITLDDLGRREAEWKYRKLVNDRARRRVGKITRGKVAAARVWDKFMEARNHE